MIELRQWRQFISLAEDLHFGHAATRLHKTQPALPVQRHLVGQVGAAATIRPPWRPPWR